MSPRGDKPPLPTCEAHVRRLIQLKPEDRARAWKAAVDLAEGKEMTAKVLKRALEPFVKANPKRKAISKRTPLRSALDIMARIEEAVRGGQEKEKILDLLHVLKRALLGREREDESERICEAVADANPVDPG